MRSATEEKLVVRRVVTSEAREGRDDVVRARKCLQSSAKATSCSSRRLREEESAHFSKEDMVLAFESCGWLKFWGEDGC